MTNAVNLWENVDDIPSLTQIYPKLGRGRQVKRNNEGDREIDLGGSKEMDKEIGESGAEIAEFVETLKEYKKLEQKEEAREHFSKPRTLLLVDLGLALLEKALENGHVVNCDEFKVCYWCDCSYDWDDEECKDHADDCVWPMIEHMIDSYT